jgi:hypothetical protein
VDWYQDNLDGEHAGWMAKHVQMYNEWAATVGKPSLKLTRVRTRSYAGEWIS